MLDVVDTAIADTLRTLGDTWQPVDYENIGSVKQSAIERMCSAGLVEIECEVTVKMESEETFLIASIRRIGFDEKQQRQDAAVATVFPKEWWDEKGVTRAKTNWVEKVLRVRLTVEGAKARQDLVERNDTFVFSYVRNGFIQGRGPACRIDLFKSEIIPVTQSVQNCSKQDSSQAVDNIAGGCMTDDEMALEVAKHFEWCETVEPTRELETMLKQIQKLSKARAEWIEHRESKSKSEQELEVINAEILARWNKLRRDITPILEVASKLAMESGIDDMRFHEIKRLVRKGILDSQLFDAVEAGLNETERLESRNLDRIDSSRRDSTGRSKDVTKSVERKRRARNWWLGPALAELKKSINLSDAEIAKEIGANKSLLSKSKEWQKMRRTLEQQAIDSIPRGSKYDGGIEAYSN